MRDDFCAFILTHGRPDKVVTYDLIRRRGYTGKVYIVIDDEDTTGDEYRRLYGDQVLTFSKNEIASFTDQYDNFTDRRAILWARNACWKLAQDVDCRYFIQLDDDYHGMMYRLAGKREPQGNVVWRGWSIHSLDEVWEALVRFIETTPTDTICMSQGGDHFGGDQGDTSIKMKRKAMNSFVLDRNNPFLFSGRINEDVNTYVGLGRQGKLFFTHMSLQLDQQATQTSSGGMTELYLHSGTYVKSFYSVITAPSCVTIRSMGRMNRRLHHSIQWDNAVPVVISETHRKHRGDAITEGTTKQSRKRGGN